MSASLVSLLLLAAFSGTQAVTAKSSSLSSEMVNSAATDEEMKGRLVRVMRTEVREALKKAEARPDLDDLNNQHAESATSSQVVREGRPDFFEELVNKDESSTTMVTVTSATTTTPGPSGAVVNGIQLPPGFTPLNSFGDLNAKAPASAPASATDNATDNATGPPPCVHTTTPCPTLPPCDFSPWTRWGDCSTTCGPGVKERHRKNNGDHKCIGAFKEEEECGQDTICPPTTSTTPAPPPTTPTTTPYKAPIAAVGPSGEIINVFPNGTVNILVNGTTTTPKPKTTTTATTTPSECEANRTRDFYKELMESHYKTIMDHQPCTAKRGPPFPLSPYGAKPGPTSPLAAMPGPNATSPLAPNGTMPGMIMHPNAPEEESPPAPASASPLLDFAPGPCKQHNTTTSTTPCPVPECTFSTWSDWTACSVTCGSGLMQRHREKTDDVPCTGAYMEELECREAACAVAL